MPTFLARDPELLKVPLEPLGPTAVSDVPPDARDVLRAWNLHGGLLAALSERVRIDVGCATAVLCVESGGNAFGPDGRMIIRFENHIFRKQWGGRTFDQHFRYDAQRPWEGHQFRAAPDEPWSPFHGRQAMEWRVFDFARRRHETAAMRSISMGAPQIMGFNHARVGYDTVQEMFERFRTDVRFQIIGLFDFLTGGAADSPMLDALRRSDFGQFASGYNGPGQAPIYSALISRRVELFRQIHPPAGRARTPARAAPAAEPPPASAPRPVATAVPTARRERSCVVKRGETLGAIAGRYGVPLAAIVGANAITNPDAIRVGQVLRIPAADPPPRAPVPAGHQLPTDLDEDDPDATERSYTVAPGDTLSAIARRQRVGVAVLVALNGIANPDRIRVGQVLRLPD